MSSTTSASPSEPDVTARASSVDGADEPPTTLDGQGELVDVLEGDDVLELTRFTTKKAWIDDKITFLSSLAPVDAITPDPPAPSSTTQAELETWWTEHDRIETEVDTYDMGDLARLKKFAKNASKKELSPRDTDLIEITLTTLFAVDRLLHLLRNRRKALALLQYRLEWETQVAAVWTSHRQLLDFLAPFLRKARWTSLASSDPPESPLTPLTTRMPLSTSSSLSSLLSSAHSSSSSPLSLRLTQLNSSLHTLLDSTLPLSATKLDKLIDTSPSPLPESFLDEQDRIEDVVARTTNGLDRFARSMVEQWTISEEVSKTCEQVVLDTAGLDADLAALSFLNVELSAVEGLETRLEALQHQVKQAERTVQDRLPRPTHESVPDQQSENLKLVKTLRINVDEARNRVEAAQGRLSKFRVAVETVKKARSAIEVMQQTSTRLKAFVIDESALVAGRPIVDNESCLVDGGVKEQDYFRKLEALLNAVEEPLSLASGLLKEGAIVVVDLNKAGVDPSLRQDVKQQSRLLEEARMEAKKERNDRAEWRRRLSYARELDRGLERGRLETEEVQKKLVFEIGASAWTIYHPAQPPIPPFDLVPLSTHVDSVLSPLLPLAGPLLSSDYPQLYDHLQTRARALRHSFSDLSRLQSLLENLRYQATASNTFLGELHDFDDESSHLSRTIEAALAKSRAEWEGGTLETERARLATEVEELAGRVKSTVDASHERIPLIATSELSPLTTSSLPTALANSEPLPSAPPTSRPLDLTSQDSLVRTAVNTASATSLAQIDTLRQDLVRLRDLQAAFEWEAARDEVERLLAEEEESFRSTKQEFDARELDSSDSLVALLSTLGARAPPSLDPLSISLSLLPSSYLSNLKPSLDGLVDRRNTLTSSIAHLRTTTEGLQSWLSRHSATLKAIGLVQQRVINEEQKIQDATRSLKQPPTDESLASVALAMADGQTALQEMESATQLESDELKVLAEEELRGRVEDDGTAQRCRDDLERLRGALLVLGTRKNEVEAERIRQKEEDVRKAVLEVEQTMAAIDGVRMETEERLGTVETLRSRAEDERRSLLRVLELDEGSAPDDQEIRRMKEEATTLRTRVDALRGTIEQHEESRFTLNASSPFVPLPTLDSSIALAREALVAATTGLEQLDEALFQTDRDAQEWLATRATHLQERQDAFRRHHDLHAAFEQACASASDLRQVLSEAASRLSEDRDATAAERAQLLESTTLSSDLKGPTIPASHATNRASLHLSLPFLSSQHEELSTRLAEFDISLSAFPSQIVDVAATHTLSATLRAELNDLRSALQSLQDDMDAEKQSATEWIVDRDRFLEMRRRQDDWRRRWAEHEAALNEIEVALEGHEVLLDAAETAASPTPVLTALQNELARLNTSTTLSESRARLEQLEISELTLRSESSRVDVSGTSPASPEPASSPTATVVRLRWAELNTRHDAVVKRIKQVIDGETTRLDEEARRTSAAHSATPASTRSPRRDGLPSEPSDRIAFPTQPVRRSSHRITFTSPEDIADVFGSVSTEPFPFDDSSSSDEPSEVRNVRAHLEAVSVDEWLDSQAVLSLPTPEDTIELRRQLDAVQGQLNEVESSPAAVWVDLESIQKELERKESGLSRLDALANFERKVVAADLALSNLLNSIDASGTLELPPEDEDDLFSPSRNETAPATPLADALVSASEAVTAVRMDAIPLIDDARVKTSIERIEEAYSEMMGMVDDLNPRSTSSSSSAQSSQSTRLPHSTLRIGSHTSSRAASRTSSRASSTQSTASARRSSIRAGDASIPALPRTTSSLSTASSQSTASSRSTASRKSYSSLQTPTRARPLVDSPTPRRRVLSNIPVATPRASIATIPRGFSFSSTARANRQSLDLSRSTSSIPRPSSQRPSLAGLGLSSSIGPGASSTRRQSSLGFSRRDSLISNASSTTSTRKSSFGPATPSRYSRASMDQARRETLYRTPPKATKSKKPYKANPNRKVDVEVGRIVNQLDIHVSIEAAEGAYNDESGMYFIGDEENGRLYFCRILRSRTVMVRIGGGWMSLLPFLISRFGTSSGVSMSPRLSPSASLASSTLSKDPTRSPKATLASSTSSLSDFLDASAASSASASSSLLSLSMSTRSLRRSFGPSSSASAISPLRRSSSIFPGINHNLGTPSASSTSALSATTNGKPKGATTPMWRP